MNLDEMKTAVDKLRSLLADQQIGSMAWNMFLKECLQEVVDMAASAGITARTKS